MDFNFYVWGYIKLYTCSDVLSRCTFKRYLFKHNLELLLLKSIDQRFQLLVKGFDAQKIKTKRKGIILLKCWPLEIENKKILKISKIPICFEKQLS